MELNYTTLRNSFVPSINVGTTITDVLNCSTLNLSTFNTSTINISGTLSSYGNQLISIGTIIMFYNSSIPAGWALCNGQTVTRTDGGGSITTPNLVGSFVFGGSAAYTTQRGASTITLTTANLPSHTHTINDPGHSHTQYFGWNGGNQHTMIRDPNQVWDTQYAGYTSVNPTGISLYNTGSATEFSIMPPFVVLCYIMKY